MSSDQSLSENADAQEESTVAPAASEPVVESAEAGEPTAAAETGSAETNSAEPASAGVSDEAARRIRLSPKVDPDQFKAVPTISANQAAAAGAQAVGADPNGEATTTGTGTSQADAKRESYDAPPPVNATPVDIPPVEENLDADLEAEIEAAMAGEEQAISTASAADAQADADQPAAGEETDEADSEEALEAGTRLKGKVQSVHADDVFLDVGYRSPGVFKIRQLESAKSPEVGQAMDVVVDRYDAAQGLILVNLPTGPQKISGNWEAVSVGQIVDCVVTKTNKGGLEVQVGSLRGFMPSGQVDLRFVENLEPFVGQKLRSKITEANRQKRNLIVSRRAFLEIERQEAEETLWKTLEVGQDFKGTVTTIKDYGAFIDIGGVDAFLHIGQISWMRIDHPSEVIEVGQPVDVKILTLDEESKKISVGMRQLIQNPWDGAAERFQTGMTVNGKVTRTMDFGAFVEIDAGVEGLVHISELDYKRVNKVTDVLTVGQEVDVQVLEVDTNRKRIGLSLKALKAKPDSVTGKEKVADEDMAPSGGEAYVRKNQADLKGGTGGTLAGGLFGNPTDFS